ncbi:MAG: glycosyl hydrolase, partial [Lewinella sp.]|nr:glycosyl hydrolase [Lewinella sp.]
TNEGAGGENYGTLSYIVESPHESGVIWTGSDDGLVYLTRNGGESWDNVTPKGLQECLINAIEVSPHDPATVYIATTRYKFNDLKPGLYKTTNYGQSWTKIDKGIPDGACTRVVREDNERNNLLFAGTETGLYVSYDGGQNWSTFQLNLPIVPITDLMIRHGDLIAATQGRAFWVLDDLPLLRQYDPKQEGVVMFQPEPAIRVGGGSELNQSSSGVDGTDLLQGVNPATGMVIYYQLPELADSLELTLEIRDAGGVLVRSFSSLSDPDFESYPGGPGADPVLSTLPGLNRFVWDMRYPTLPGVPKTYLEGSYSGHRAMPGTYTLTLKGGDNMVKTPGTILPMPTIDAGKERYQQQHDMMMATAATVTEMHGMVNEMKAVRMQIDQWVKRLSEKEDRSALAAEGKALVKTMTEWDGELVQRKSQSYDDVINFPNKLSAEYLFVRGQMNTNIPILTTAVKERITLLDSQWAGLKARAAVIMDEVRAYNRKLEEADFQPLYIKE